MTGLAALERRLVDAYREQLRHYDRAVDILRQAPNGSGDGAWVEDLHAVLAQLSASDVPLSEDKAAWRQSGRQPGPELRALWERLAARINTLEAGVARHMANIEAGKKQLLPAIDTLIQKRRMLQAYGKHGG